MLKSVIACLAATALVAITALTPTDASAGRGGGPQWGTWNWPPMLKAVGAECPDLRAAMCG